LPAEQSAEFVWHMEEVLDLYCRPYDPLEPVVCMDEMGKNLVAEKRPHEPMRPGVPERYDYTYEKRGARNVFILTEPLAGRRFCQVTHHHSREDWAHFIEQTIAQHYSQARRIHLVMDQLNTHSPISWYQTFSAEHARALTERIEIHHTPKHGSWLNMAEIELSVLVRQGIAHNVGSEEELCEQIRLWQDRRNREHHTIHWQFPTADARIKLARLYPVYDSSHEVHS
jgi:hypothetical protein